MSPVAVRPLPSVRPHWVADEFGIVLQDNGSPVGLRMAELIEVGLRRNPRRAQLLVSTVLGKHLAADPRAIVGVGRLLGALVGRALDGTAGPVPASWPRAARETVSGEDPAALSRCWRGPARRHGRGAYLWLRRDRNISRTPGRRSTGLRHTCIPPGGATGSAGGRGILRAAFARHRAPAPAGPGRPAGRRWPDRAGGRRTVHRPDGTECHRGAPRVAPRGRYVLAGLVDVRSEADDGNRVAVERRLGCRIDVVSLVQGEIVVPGRGCRSGGGRAGEFGRDPTRSTEPGGPVLGGAALAGGPAHRGAARLPR